MKICDPYLTLPPGAAVPLLPPYLYVHPRLGALREKGYISDRFADLTTSVINGCAILTRRQSHLLKKLLNAHSLVYRSRTIKSAARKYILSSVLMTSLEFVYSLSPSHTIT
jgi:hypothetical protein